MADTGFIAPGTAVGNRAIAGSDIDWVTPDNIKIDDANLARAFHTTTTEQSSGLAASNFDFTVIPEGSTIDGIEVRVFNYEEGINQSLTTWEVGKLILADGSDGGTSKHADMSPPTTDAQTDFMGGASDLWDETIGWSDVQDVDWGFFLGEEGISLSSSAMNVAGMRMKVYYTPAPVITDVNTTESWDDGDTGLVITGTNFLVGV